MSNKRLTGGGNILKGIPPTSTNFYGLVRRSHVSRIKAGMGQPPVPPTLSAATYFSVGASSNRIFHDIGHHYNIVSSGSGTGKTGGFNSSSSPFGSPAYASFGGTSDPDPLELSQRYCPNHPTSSLSPCVDPDDTIVTELEWNKQGRYIKSKTLAELNVTPVSWGRLKDITITWIAGSGTNGGDKPDIFAFNAVSPNQTGLPTDGPMGDYRCRENLYVQFFNWNNLPMGSRFILWKTKPDLILTDLNANTPGGHSPVTPNPWSAEPTIVYPSTEFTTTVISAAEFNIDLSLAKFFVIRQTRHTALLDNYGIKYVNLEFV
jgi:hypothetical protein